VARHATPSRERNDSTVTKTSEGMCEMRDGVGFCGRVGIENDERLSIFALGLAVIDCSIFGELIVRDLSYPAVGGIWKGDSSSIAVNGDGGSDRLEEIDTALPSPLGRRMSSSDMSVPVGE
jgi:hypothetical protein